MNNIEDKIIVLTVTYNSAEYLYKSVNSLLNQTIMISRIVIVDNASDEKNRKIIDEIESLSSNILVLHMNSNLGGAGGFEKGVSYIKDTYKYDYIWIMDDDAYPTRNCLEKLLENKLLNNIGALCPVIYGIDNKEYQLYHHKKLKFFLTSDKMVYSKYESVPKISCIDANAFVGVLIPENVVNLLGVPDGSLFIYGDDTEYTYRISRKFNVYLVKNAIINHRDINAENNDKPSTWWKTYYNLRNRYFLIDKYAPNIVYLFIARIIKTLKVFFHIIKTIFAFNIVFELKLKKIKMYLLVIKDAFNNKRGESNELRKIV